MDVIEAGWRLMGQGSGVPEWRDPQRMLGSVFGQAVSGGILLVISRVVQHVYVTVRWS